ncbi:MAG: PAS domain S-box protein, partial [Cellvibrionales bacterium]
MNDEQLLALGLQPVTIDIIQRSHDFFGMADMEGHALFVNEAGRRIFGLGQDQDISHLTMLDFISKQDHMHFATEVVEKSLSQPKVRSTVRVVNFSTRETFLMDFSFFVQRDTTGEPLCYMAFAADLRDALAKSDVLNTVQDTLNVGGWRLDLSTGLALWSDKVYELHKVPTGTPVEKLDAINFYAPHERERIAYCVEEGAARGTPWDIECEFYDAEGTHKWVRATGKAIRDEHGNITHLTGTFQDISERKRLEIESQRTRRELEIFKEVIEHSLDFIGIANADNQPIYLNKAGREMLGIPLDQPIETISIAECYPEENREQLVNEVLSALETTGSYRGETLFRHFQTNEDIPVYDTHFLIGDPGSADDLGHATISRDIRREVALRQNLETEKAKSLQAAKLASLGEMSAGVAHEINNPLAVISGSNELIARAPDNPEKVLKQTKRIEKSVRRIGVIVNGLKKFSRTSSDLNLENCDINAIVQECISLLEPRARRFGHQL